MPNKAKNEVVDSLVQAGVIQSIEAPKTEYVVSIPDAQQLDTIVEKFIEADELLFEGDSLMQTTAKALGKLFGVAPTYSQYMTVRQMWIRKYMAQMPSSSEEATQKHWERLFKRVNKETGLDKPKAPSKAAVKMSEKRKAEVAMLKALGDDQLVEMLAAYKAEDNFTKANAVKKEMKDRNKSADDAINAERKELREQIRKQLAQTTDIELLRKVSAMLPRLVMQAQ